MNTEIRAAEVVMFGVLHLTGSSRLLPPRWCVLLGAGSPKRRIRQRTRKAIAVEDKRNASCTREVYAFGHTSVSPTFSFRGKPMFNCHLKNQLLFQLAVSSGIN